MQSGTQLYGQYQQLGPPSQSSQTATQLTHDTMRNGTENYSPQYATSNQGVRLPQSAHFTYSDRTYCNGQTSDWQTSAVPYQAVSYQQPVGGNNDNYSMKGLSGYVQNTLLPLPNGNPQLLVNNGFQFSDFHQNNAQYALRQSPHNMMTSNSTYSQQDMSKHWRNQSIRTQHRNGVSDLHNCRIQKSLFQSVNGESTKSVSPSFTTATSLPHEQVLCTRTLGSATDHNRQAAYHHSTRQISTQNGLFPSFPPPSYSMATSCSFGNNNISTNSSLSEQNLHVTNSNMIQEAQQPPTQLISRLNNWEKATSSIHSNSYSRQYETSVSLSNTNGLHSNTAAHTQEQMHSQQIIARIEDDLRNSFPAESDGHPLVYHSSEYREKQFVSDVRMTGSNQNMQPAALNVSENDTSNVFKQSLSLNSGLSLPKTNQRVISGAQHSMNASPQKGSIPIASPYATSTRDGRGNGANAFTKFVPTSNRENLVGSLHGGSQMMILPKTTSSVANTNEMLKMLLLGKANDCSIHSSPGRTGTRAVAVVQPLSQKGFPVAREHTSSNTIFQSDECTATDKSSSDIDKLLSPCVAKKTEVEVPESGTGKEDKSENPPDPTASVCELSLIPTIPWTAASLNKLILDGEKLQMKLVGSCTTSIPPQNVLATFWKDNLGDLKTKMETCWYQGLMTDVVEFSTTNSDSVVLSQVKNGFEKQLECYHVLQDKEVYSEPPYISSWLNVNEQLDDIDKEFGFHLSWKHCFPTLESDIRPDKFGEADINPLHIVSELSTEVLSKTELKPIDSIEEKQVSTVKAAPTHPASPNTESADSSDPFYSFQIEVLHPEEAKLIFEQGQSKMLQSMDKDSQPETITSNSVEGDLPKDIDVPLNDSKLENVLVSPSEHVCCLKRWMEMICDSHSLSKCNCKKELDHEDNNDNTLDQEEMAIQKEDILHVIMPDRKCLSVTEGENQTKSMENVLHQIMVYNWSDQFNERSQTIALAEDEKPQSYFEKGSKETSCQSSIIIRSENEDLSTSKSEILNQMPDSEKDSEHVQVKMTKSSGADNNEKETKDISCSDTENQSDREVDCVQDPLKSPGTAQLCTLDSSDNKIKDLPVCEDNIQMLYLEDNCEQAQVSLKDVTQLSLETEEQTEITAMAALRRTFTLGGKHENLNRKRKDLCSPDRFPPFLKKSNKGCVDVVSQVAPEDVSNCRKVLVDAKNGKALATHVRPIELALFGSAQQNKCASVGVRKRSHEDVSNAVPRPPEVISVIPSPLKRKSNGTAPTGKYSVKPRSNASFQPTKMRCKTKMQGCTFAPFSGGSLMKAERIGPTNIGKLPVSTEMKFCNRKHFRKWRRYHSKGKKHGVETIRKYMVTLKQPERSNAENGSHAGTPQQNTVLKFSVLPNTFNFTDGPSGRKETNDPVPDRQDLVEKKNKRHKKAFMRKSGSWHVNPEKKYSPLPPKTSFLFRMFRQKYMEQTKPSVDE